MKRVVLPAMFLAACSQQAQQNETANAPETAALTPAPAANEPAPEAPLNPPAPGEPGGLPDDRTPVSEGKIDPKSAQGAGQVLQSYFALAEQGGSLTRTSFGPMARKSWISRNTRKFTPISAVPATWRARLAPVTSITLFSFTAGPRTARNSTRAGR